MLRRSVSIRLLLCGGVVLFAVGGCARQGPLSGDTQVATRQIAEHFPKGTSVTRAKQTLVDQGFQLSQLEGQGANHLLLASYTQGDRTWKVGLLIIDEKVAGSSVTIVDTSASAARK